VTARVAAGALLLALVATPLQASKKPEVVKPRIDDLVLSVEQDRLRVSFRLVDGLSDEAMEQIHSGIEITFNHRVDVLARRGVPLWWARVVARARIVTKVTYDPLTRQYAMRRDTEMRRRGKRVGVPTTERRTTELTEEARSWMTEIDEIPPLDLPPDEPHVRLRVRVESAFDRKYVLYLFPSRRTVSAERPVEP